MDAPQTLPPGKTTKVDFYHLRYVTATARCCLLTVLAAAFRLTGILAHCSNYALDGHNKEVGVPPETQTRRSLLGMATIPLASMR